MDIALMVIGVAALLLAGVWMFSRMNDAESIGTEEEVEVHKETPEEHERAHVEEVAKDAEAQAADIDFYSRGEDNSG